MDGYNALQNIEAQMKQLQNILNQPKPTVPTIPTIPAPQPQIMTIPFVDGIDGAKQFLKSMAANSSAAVFDKTESVFYTLSVDANGNAAPIKLGRFTVEDAAEAWRRCCSPILCRGIYRACFSALSGWWECP